MSRRGSERERTAAVPTLSAIDEAARAVDGVVLEEEEDEEQEQGRETNTSIPIKPRTHSLSTINRLSSIHAMAMSRLASASRPAESPPLLVGSVCSGYFLEPVRVSISIYFPIDCLAMIRVESKGSMVRLSSLFLLLVSLSAPTNGLTHADLGPSDPFRRLVQTDEMDGTLPRLRCDGREDHMP
jgi:hypothetical protein